jgi:hypothetical protein
MGGFILLAFFLLCVAISVVVGVAIFAMGAGIMLVPFIALGATCIKLQLPVPAVIALTTIFTATYMLLGVAHIVPWPW